jgi:hypothetical protein
MTTTIDHTDDPVVKLIPLSSGLCATVDAEDFDRLSLIKWTAMRRRHTWYAVTMFLGKRICMHRVILELSHGDPQVDHKDRSVTDRSVKSKAQPAGGTEQTALNILVRQEASGTPSRNDPTPPLPLLTRLLTLNAHMVFTEI